MGIIEFLKDFSLNYANAVSAAFACAMFILAFFTLRTLKSEFKAKYRPYVIPQIEIQKLFDNNGYQFYLIPRNVGPHICEIKIQDIKLTIGDEIYTTPDNQEWILVSPTAVTIKMPVGSINNLGIENIRTARYRSNRVDIQFRLLSQSIDKTFNEDKIFLYEINFLSAEPSVQFRPEWIKKN